MSTEICLHAVMQTKAVISCRFIQCVKLNTFLLFTSLFSGPFQTIGLESLFGQSQHSLCLKKKTSVTLFLGP